MASSEVLMNIIFAYVGPFMSIVGLLLMIGTILYVAVRGMQVGVKGAIDMMGAFLLISTVLVIGFALIWNLTGIVYRDWMTKGDTADYISGQWQRIGVVDQKSQDPIVAPKAVATAAVYTDVLATFDPKPIRTKSGTARVFNALTGKTSTVSDADKPLACGFATKGKLLGCPVYAGIEMNLEDFDWLGSGISIPPQLLPAMPSPTKIVITPAQCKAKFVKFYNNGEFKIAKGPEGVPAGYTMTISGQGPLGYVPGVGDDSYDAEIIWGAGVEPTKFRMSYAKGSEFGIWRVSKKTVEGTNPTICAP